jgi:hypothetical protein
MSDLNVGAPARLGEPNHSTTDGAFGPEYWAVTARRTNVLIQGSSVFVADMLAAVRRDLHHPEFVWPDVPAAIDTRAATVLVPEVGALSADARDALDGLIARSYSRIQVVATSSVALYELVARGQFHADLYYRLNVVMLTDGWPALAVAETNS